MSFSLEKISQLLHSSKISSAIGLDVLSFNILKFGVNPFLEFMAAIVTNTFIVGVIHSPWKSAALIFILMTTRSDILSKQFRHTAVLSRVLKLIKHSIQSFIFLSYCL